MANNNEVKTPIPAMLYNAAVGGHVTNSQQVIDETLNREQGDINQETVGAVPYNSTTPNGMGRIVLKKTDNFKTIVEAQTNGNTIFVIKYDFTLSGDVTVPANCVLEFNGGSISGNYKLTGNNTNIIAYPNSKILSGIDIRGIWIVKDIYVTWMNIPTPSECAVPVRSILRLQNDNIYQNVYLPNLELAYTPNSDTYITPNDGRQLIILSSNTHLHLINTIKVNSNALRNYEVIEIGSKENVTIDGGGTIYGDVDTHDYSAGGTFEWGIGINTVAAKYITIKNVICTKLTGDGIYLGGNEESVIGQYSHACNNVVIDNVTCTFNGRQGMSVTHSRFVNITNSVFSNTGNIQAAPNGPYSGIDFEPNYNTQSFCDIRIDNCVFENNRGHSVDFYSGGDCYAKNIYITNCILGDCPTENNTPDNKKDINYGNDIFSLSMKVDNFIVDNCKIKGINGLHVDGTNAVFDNVYIHNSKVYGLFTYDEITDHVCIHNWHFENCIFDGSIINITSTQTVNTFFFLRSANRIWFKNCTGKGLTWTMNIINPYFYVELDGCNFDVSGYFNKVINSEIGDTCRVSSDAYIFNNHIGGGIFLYPVTTGLNYTFIRNTIDGRGSDDHIVWPIAGNQTNANLIFKNNICEDGFDLSAEQTFIAGKTASLVWKNNYS